MIVVQAEERNMYDQHFLSAILTERYPFLHSYDYLNTKAKTFIFFSPSSRADSLICIICATQCDIKGHKGRLSLRKMIIVLIFGICLAYWSYFPEL